MYVHFNGKSTVARHVSRLLLVRFNNFDLTRAVWLLHHR